MENISKTIVVTGASDGIGAEACRKLKKMGHNVVVVGRNPSKTKKVAEELSAPYHIADFAKLSDVVRLAEELEKYPKIDVLANNAGAVMKDRKVTEDGVELTFQTNVLSAFLLTNLLMEKLCSSNATVIQTSSIASNLFGGKFDIKDVQNEKAYTPTKAYGESKLCDIFLTIELDRRFREKGISAVAFEPGVPRTNFASEGPAFLKFMYHTPFKYLFTSSVKKSADRLVRLAVGEPQKDFECGATYSGKKKFKLKKTYSSDIPEKLWNICEKLTEKYLSKNS